MLGYDARLDPQVTGELPLESGFDHAAKVRSLKSLVQQIPALIFARDEGVTFGELFVAICNETPATEQIIKEAVTELVSLRELEVTSVEGAEQRSPNTFAASDQVATPRQKTFSFI